MVIGHYSIVNMPLFYLIINGSQLSPLDAFPFSSLPPYAPTKPQSHAYIITHQRLLLPSVCMFDKFHLKFSFKSKVSSDTFKNKNECQLTSTFDSKMPPQFQII